MSLVQSWQHKAELYGRSGNPILKSGDSTHGLHLRALHLLLRIQLLCEFPSSSFLALHDELAKVNEKWGLTRGVSIAETGARHRSTEEYRRWLANECVTLEAQMLNTRKALEDLNVELLSLIHI